MKRQGKSWASAGIVLLIAAFLITFLIVPLVLAGASGFMVDGRPSLYWLGRVLSNPVIGREFANSLTVAVCTTALCAAVSLPLALFRARTTFRGQGAFSLLVLLPLILPPFVGALSIRRLFSQYGSFNMLLERLGFLDFSGGAPPDWLGGGFFGVVVLQTLHLFPIMYLNATAALANVDPSYSEAARNLGAGPWRSFWRVTLPLIRPGLFAGGTIVFIWALTDIGTPLMLQYDELVPVRVFKELARGEFGGMTYSVVFLLLTLSLMLYVAGKFWLGRDIGQGTKSSGQAVPVRLGWWWTLCAWCLFGGLILLAVLPHLGVVAIAFADRWVNTVLPSEWTLRHVLFVARNPATYNSIVNSVKYAGAATILDLFVGGTVAWVAVRSRMPGRKALDALAMLPLAVPGLILAAGYVAMTVAGSPFEAIGPMRNPFGILVIAYTVRRLPFVVRGVSAGLQQIPESLEEAARNLGASRFRTFVRITAPLILANVIAAGVLTFSFAVLEVSDSLVLAQLPRHYPITKQIYTLAVSSGSPDTLHEAAALGVLGMLFLGATMGLAALLLGKRLGALFRA